MRQNGQNGQNHVDPVDYAGRRTLFFLRVQIQPL